MSHDDERRMTAAHTQLDAELRAVPLEVAPGRDLWPGIAARIEAERAPVQQAGRRHAWGWQAAAAVVLVAGSSLLTASLLDRQAPANQSASQPAGVVVDESAAPRAASGATGNAAVMPAAFGPSGRLDQEYVAARQQLTRVLDERISALPPSARAKLEFNLGEMRRAADEINAALAAQPGDPLLEELLLKTYQDELAVLSNVSELTNSLGRTTTGKRMQL